jgi:hypothetical protein
MITAFVGPMATTYSLIAPTNVRTARDPKPPNRAVVYAGL